MNPSSENVVIVSAALVDQPAPARRQRALVEAMLDAAIAAWRGGTLGALLAQHPLAARWLMRPFRALLRGSAGDEPGLSADATLLLRWGVTLLRPDGQPGFDGIDDDAWLRLPSWRPVLALACHSGCLDVPAFPARYHRRPDEPALDNLCGLWGVAPSSVYRYLERARQLLARAMLEAPGNVPRRLALRRHADDTAAERLGLEGAARKAWHGQACRQALDRHDAVAGLWHATQAGEMALALEVLRGHAAALAAALETDALVARLAAWPLSPSAQVELALARATLARTRGELERERSAYDQALQTAQAADDRRLLGIVYGALGKFHEPRDADRAFACYQDSAELLRDAEVDAADAVAAEQLLTTLVRLAWLYLLRNDPRGRATLDRADALRQRRVVPDAVLGMLEQTWGEYWIRAGEAARSIEHRQRALNLFERLGDQRSLLVTHLNLIFAYAEAKDFARAERHAQHILNTRVPVEPELLVSTHLNLGAAYFWQARLDDAIVEYKEALAASQRRGLRLHAFRARYNLAEAHYARFKAGGDAADEQAGDAHVAAALASPASDSSPAAVEAARRLKAETLGAPEASEPDRLLPEETALHVAAFAELRRQRERLAQARTPAVRFAAQLAIAEVYVGIAVHERDAARAIAEHDGLASAADALARLQAGFERDLPQAQRLASCWQAASADLIDDPRRLALATAMLEEGALSKRAYAEVCGVSPATASKHLTLLTTRGMLMRTGRGPSTRYLQAPAD